MDRVREGAAAERDRARLEGAMTATALLHDVSVRAVRALADLGVVRTYRAQTYLFHEGDLSDTVFFLVQGRIEIGTIAGTGHRRLLATMARPQFLEDSIVWGASADRFLGFLEAHFEATRVLLQRMAAQIQDHETFTEDLIHLDLKGRVAKLLLRTASPELEPLPADGTEIAAATHADLAAMCGGSRENVTRVLSDFQRRGLIQRHGRRLVLSEVGGLARLAGL
jgi:CRP/FNR family transcriptional regulator